MSRLIWLFQIWLTPSTNYGCDVVVVRVEVLCRGGDVAGSGWGFC
jgi:hypothetical protein